jgi:hypothetical protein
VEHKYFEPNAFYAEFAKPWQQRRLPMRYEQRDDIIEVYRLWRELNADARGATS